MADNKNSNQGQTGDVSSGNVYQPLLKTRPDTTAQNRQRDRAGRPAPDNDAASSGSRKTTGKRPAGAARRRSGAAKNRAGAASQRRRAAGQESEAERKKRLKKYQSQKEEYLRRKRQKMLMRRLLPVAAVLAAVLILTGVIAIARKVSQDRQRKEAEAAEAAEIARTQTQVDAAEVLHLSFPVLTLDKEEKEDTIIDEDGDGIPDDFVDEDGDGIPDDEWLGDTAPEEEGPLMLDTDGDGLPDTEAVVDTDGDGKPDAPEGAVAYEDADTLTVQEFNSILKELYEKDYVLVDIYSLAESGENGFEKSMISVPVGKKPLIISQRDASYSAKTDGHVDRLIAEDGAVATQYTNADGEEVIGVQDVVPAVEEFIRQHPDFSFKGARGIVGVTGYRGLFGYQVVLDEAVITTPMPDVMASADHVLNGGDTVWETGDTEEGADQEGETDTTAEAETEQDADTGDGQETETGEAQGADAGEGQETEAGAAEETDAGTEQVTGDETGQDAESESDQAQETGQDEQPGEDAATEAGDAADAGQEAGDTDTAADEQAEGEAQALSGQDTSAEEETSPVYIGNAAVNSNIHEVEQIIDIMRGTGWRLACNGYSLLSYGSETEMMKEDVDIWKEDIGEILGTTDILLFPKQTDIGGWGPYQETNEKYTYLRDAGFRYFCIEDDEEYSWLQVQPEYLRQGIHEIRNYHDFEEFMQRPAKGV